MTSHPLFLITYKRMRALFLLLFGVIGLFFFGVHILQRGVYGRHGETQCLFPFLSSQRKGKRGCGDAFLLWELFRMHAYRIRIHGLWMIHDSQYGCFLSFFFWCPGWFFPVPCSFLVCLSTYAIIPRESRLRGREPVFGFRTRRAHISFPRD